MRISSFFILGPLAFVLPRRRRVRYEEINPSAPTRRKEFPMSNNVPEGWLDYKTFEENRRRFPQEELMKYAGQNIAWSIDGTRIIASGKDVNELVDKLEAMGVEAGTFVIGYIGDPDVSQLC
jgi:hypothetical protein